MRVTHNKLVRDRIPELIERDGKRCIVSKLDHNEYVRELKRKLLEEAQEANAAELTVELADLLEVVVSLCESVGITMTAVEHARMMRAAERGRFESRLSLKDVVSSMVGRAKNPDKARSVRRHSNVRFGLQGVTSDIVGILSTARFAP